MALLTFPASRTTPATIWECRMCGRQQVGALVPRACRYCGIGAFEDDGRCWQWAECPGMRTSALQRMCPVCHTSPFRRAHSRL